LNIKKPRKNIPPVKINEYRVELKLICPTPKTIYLNDSTIADIGFARMIHLYFSGTMESGKMTGEAYMSSWTPKPIRKRTSLYLEVMAEIKSPKPRP
jgi:hypothetical protein